MLDVDRVWARVSQLPPFQGMKLTDFGLQVFGQSFTLTSGQTSSVTPVQFANKSIILSIAAGARPDAAAAAQGYTDGLDMFRVACQIEGGRYIIGTSALMASAVFAKGTESSFPAREIVLFQNTKLLYTVTNLTTTTIDVDIAHHVLTPVAVG
jgi:hypothetical protein